MTDIQKIIRIIRLDFDRGYKGGEDFQTIYGQIEDLLCELEKDNELETR